jgi:hypothetical protein
VRRDNLATVKGIYDAFGKGDVDHCRGTEDTAATLAMLGK